MVKECNFEVFRTVHDLDDGVQTSFLTQTLASIVRSLFSMSLLSTYTTDSIPNLLLTGGEQEADEPGM